MVCSKVHVIEFETDFPFFCHVEKCEETIYMDFLKGVYWSNLAHVKRHVGAMLTFGNTPMSRVFGKKIKERKKKAFSLWLSGLRTRHCLCEDVGSILGLAQEVKSLPLSQATA